MPPLPHGHVPNYRILVAFVPPISSPLGKLSGLAGSARVLHNNKMISTWVGNGPKPRRICDRREDTTLNEIVCVSAPCRTVNIAAVT